ncbi:DUF309 domain-containing protein [Laceyella putida]|uniref:DUF309 domain-containing protein n=1 Tax=Laceyella putida TaxID=110101 RepID=A0ABW2RLM4_9BACL
MSDYPRLYIDFLYYFNVKQDYYECHEVLEELWLEEGRERFYQGLLQVAVGLYHHKNGNRGGAVKLWMAAMEKLALYPQPQWMGIDTAKVLEETEYRLRAVEAGSDETFAPMRIRIVDGRLRDEVERRTGLEKDE